jgi:hypothetical protein
MKFKALTIALSLGLVAGAAHAVPGNYEIIQTQTFSDSLSTFDPAGGSYTSTTPRIMTVNPFSSYNTGSGILNSVTIRWNSSWKFTGTSDSGNGVYSASISSGSGQDGSGQAYVGPYAYSGGGGGNGDGGGPNSPNSSISFTATWNNSNPADYVFALPSPGNYNPNIATLLSGSNPFTVASGGASDGSGGWGTFTYSGIASGLLTANGDVTVKYSYFGEQVPAAVPVPATLALLGLGLAGIGAVRRSTSPR